MKLFLSGGGSGEKSRQVDEAFINVLDKSKPVLYIPLARRPPYDSCLAWVISNFNPLNFNNFEMLINFEDLNKLDLSKYSGIYLGGGNTFYLLKGLKDSDSLKTLKKYIQLGGIVYGGSAGAIILGKDILTSGSKNEVQLDSYDSLGMVGEFSIFCHYKENEDDLKIKDYLQKQNIPILVLTDDSGILFEEGNIKMFGPGRVFIVDNSGKREIFPTDSTIL